MGRASETSIHKPAITEKIEALRKQQYRIQWLTWGGAVWHTVSEFAHQTFEDSNDELRLLRFDMDKKTVYSYGDDIGKKYVNLLSWSQALYQEPLQVLHYLTPQDVVKLKKGKEL